MSNSRNVAQSLTNLLLPFAKKILSVPFTPSCKSYQYHNFHFLLHLINRDNIFSKKCWPNLLNCKVMWVTVGMSQKASPTCYSLLQRKSYQYLLFPLANPISITTFISCYISLLEIIYIFSKKCWPNLRNVVTTTFVLCAVLII